jgi:beta-lactam-binding protein with PASTA domain
MDKMLLIQVVLPLAISVIGGIVTASMANLGCKPKAVVLALANVVIAGILIYNWMQSPKLVIVPDVVHQFRDQADYLCRKVGLRPIIRVRDEYTGVLRTDEVGKQSLSPGAQEYIGREIELAVSRGDFLAGQTSADCPSQQEAQATKTTKDATHP